MQGRFFVYFAIFLCYYYIDNMKILKKYISEGLLEKPLNLWLIFFFITFLIYFFVINLFFVSDDFHWLYLAQEQNISWRFFTQNYEGNHNGGSYNPIFFLIFNILHSIFGLKYYLYNLVAIILHATNAFLFYFISKRIFSLIKLPLAKNWAWVASLLYLIWPTNVETIAWMSANMHLWATLFYLSSLLFYFKYLEDNLNKNFYYSLLFFFFSIFSKETAISLPFVILSWEIYLTSRRQSQEKKGNFNFKRLVAYFSVLFIFLIARYKSIGLFLGYYAKDTLGWPIKEWAGNLVAYGFEFATASYFREIFFKVWYYYLDYIVISLCLFLVVYLYNILIKKNEAQFTILVSLLFSLLPFLPLGLHRMTFAGERYLYLPGAFFIILFIYLLSRAKFSHKLKLGAVLFVVLCSGIIIQVKSIAWQKSSNLSRQILASYQYLNIDKGQKLASVALPDNLAGAQLFRNNLQQALQLYYPENYPEIINLPIYVRLNERNSNYHLLTWREDAKGWFAESTDGGHIVTGKTSIVVDSFYFELWNYNYQNYTANTIRLMPTNMTYKDDIKILIFDQGKLKILD